MDQKEDQNRKSEYTDMASMMGAWMKSAATFWENMPQAGSFDSNMFDFFPKQQKGPAYQAQKSIERGAKIAQALAGMLSEPENLDAMFKAADTAPEFVMRLSNQVWEAFLEAQKKWAERAANIGNHEKAYNFEDLDHETFEAFREIYEKEFQRFFQVPQIGLTRFYQERVNKALDKYNIFQSTLGEFLYLFYVPLEKSASVMQEKIEEMVKKGEVKDNYKDYYSMWVKILEGHYMKLLQSPEYTKVMDKTISALVDYRSARDEMMYDVLQNLPIPTNREMDELYKEFYELKKKVRELAKKVDEQGRRQDSHS